MEKENGKGLIAKWTSIAVIAIALCVTATFLWPTTEKTTPQPYEPVYAQSITVEERLADREYEIQLNKDYDIYFELPAIVLQYVLEDVGASASVSTIAQQYKMNREAYISKYVSNQFSPTIEGPDKDNIKSINITTTLNDPEPEENGKVIPLSVGDSIKK